MGAEEQRKRNPDRHTVRRYDLSLPIEVQTVPPQQAEPISGRSRDISSRRLICTVGLRRSLRFERSGLFQEKCV